MSIGDGMLMPTEIMIPVDLTGVEMPERLKARPQWKGMAVPFTTLIGLQDGVPNFKVTDRVAWDICIEEKLCALCGQPNDYWVWYIGSVQHMTREVVFDLGMHEDCARYAAVTCPYIAFGKAYGDHIKPTKGAEIIEMGPRSAYSNEGVPVFLFKCRRDAVRVVSYDQDPRVKLAKTGTIVEAFSIPRQPRVESTPTNPTMREK